MVRPAAHASETFAIVCDGPEEFRKTAREMVREASIRSRSTIGRRVLPHSGHQTVMTEAEIERYRSRRMHESAWRHARSPSR